MVLAGREFDTGTTVSAAGHSAFLLYLLVGGWFSAADPLPPVGSTDVTIMTSTQFDAMVAGVDNSETPAPQTTPPTTEPPAAEDTPPVRPPVDETAPTPVEPAPQPPQTEPVDQPPVDQPPPPSQPPTEAEVMPEDAPDPGVTDAPDPNDRPAARPEERIATETVEAPPVDVAVAPEETPAVSDEQTPNPPVEQPVVEAAPPPSTEVVVNNDSKPTRADKPRSRPAASAPPPAPDTETASDEPEVDPIAAATADALNEALNDPAVGTDTPTSDAPASDTPASAPSGPPLTAGEMDGLRIAVSKCWNVGSLSTDALRVTVNVLVDLKPDGTPARVVMGSFEGGTEAAAVQAFESARRAINRCGASGFPLPPDKYDSWRELELRFNPEKMRIR